MYHIKFIMQYLTGNFYSSESPIIWSGKYAHGLEICTIRPQYTVLTVTIRGGFPQPLTTNLWSLLVPNLFQNGFFRLHRPVIDLTWEHKLPRLSWPYKRTWTRSPSEPWSWIKSNKDREGPRTWKLKTYHSTAQE